MNRKHDEEENSTDRERDRERIMGGRSLREIFGTGLGVLCEKHSVAPAITVREENAYALIRVAPPSFRSLAGWKLGGFCAHRHFESAYAQNEKEEEKNGRKKIGGSDHFDGR